MPDNEDYERMGHLLQRPEEWSPRDREQMAWARREQRDMLRAAHPEDAKRRGRLEDVLIQLDAAIAAYDDLASN